MIALDNGPAHGDYVRYIDTLLAERAAALVASNGALPAFADAARLVPQGAWPTRAATPTSARPTANERARLSGAQAGAVAAALLSQARDRVPADGPPIELIGIAVGVAIVVAGAFAPMAGPVFVLAGIGLVYAMIRRLLARRRTP